MQSTPETGRCYLRCLCVWAFCLLLVIALQACASLNSQLHGPGDELARFTRAGQKLGLAPGDADYREALERWPGIESAQLYRRALILSLLRSRDDEDLRNDLLARLDANVDPTLAQNSRGATPATDAAASVVELECLAQLNAGLRVSRTR